MNSTNATTVRLPLRIIPRRRVQIGRIASWLAVCLVFAYLVAMKLHEQRADSWAAWKLYLIGAAVTLFALWQVIRSVAKLLPDSPFYYLRITADALEVAAPFRARRLAWSKLGAFSVAERVRSRRYGRVVDYCVIAMRAEEPDGDRYGRATIDINPDEYGAKSGQEDAEALAGWLNRLRVASLRQDSTVDVPAAFQHSIRSETAAGRTAPRQTIVRR
jgi:hypothetical protein